MAGVLITAHGFMKIVSHSNKMKYLSKSFHQSPANNQLTKSTCFMAVDHSSSQTIRMIFNKNSALVILGVVSFLGLLLSANAMPSVNGYPIYGDGNYLITFHIFVIFKHTYHLN